MFIKYIKVHQKSRYFILPTHNQSNHYTSLTRSRCFSPAFLCSILIIVFILLPHLVILHSSLTMTTTNSGINVTVILSLLCLGPVIMFVGGWDFQFSLLQLKAQEEENVQIVQQLKDKVRK